MKKTTLTVLAAISLLGSVHAFAKGGQPDALRGTASWFTKESAEIEVRGQIAAKKIGEQDLSSVKVTLTSDVTSTVLLTTAAGDIADTCKMIDDSSHHGTIIKKDVFCDNAAKAVVRPARGSNAGVLLEGIEHSLRLAIAAQPTLATGVSGVGSVLDGANFIKVQIDLKAGGNLNYLCTRFINSNNRADLNCIAQQ